MIELIGVLFLTIFTLSFIIVTAKMLFSLFTLGEYEAYIDDDTEGYVNNRRR